MKAVVCLDHRIHVVRGVRVMLDSDLAELYEVPTKALLQAVRRNEDRFPDDFSFPLTADEYSALRSQFVTSKGRGGRRYLPLVFTQEGVAMLSSVLRSERAVAANIAIMRTFAKLRQVASEMKELASRLDALERTMGKHDENFAVVFRAIRELMTPPESSSRGRIGFRRHGE